MPLPDSATACRGQNRMLLQSPRCSAILAQALGHLFLSQKVATGHVAPKAYVGRPLALVKTGDIVGIDIPARGIRRQVSDEELLRRRTALTGPAPRWATAGCPHAIFAKLTKVAILTSWRRTSAAPSTSRPVLETP
jgi:Dehydratase family